MRVYSNSNTAKCEFVIYLWLYLFRHLAYFTSHTISNCLTKIPSLNSNGFVMALVYRWQYHSARSPRIFNGNTSKAKQYSDDLSVYFVFLCETVRDMPTPLHSYSIPSLFVQSAIQRGNINVSFFYKFFRNWSIEFSFNSVTVRNATDHRFPLDAPKVLWDLKLFSKSKPF